MQNFFPLTLSSIGQNINNNTRSDKIEAIQQYKYKKTSNNLYKTKLCPLNLLAICPKGSNCNFAHSREELRQLPNLIKTKLCLPFMKNGFCKFGNNCSFAHGESELRAVDSLDRRLSINSSNIYEYSSSTQSSCSCDSTLSKHFAQAYSQQTYTTEPLQKLSFSDEIFQAHDNFEDNNFHEFANCAFASPVYPKSINTLSNLNDDYALWNNSLSNNSPYKTIQKKKHIEEINSHNHSSINKIPNGSHNRLHKRSDSLTELYELMKLNF